MPLEVQEENDSQIECYPQVLSFNWILSSWDKIKDNFQSCKVSEIKNVPATHSFRELIRMPQTKKKKSQWVKVKRIPIV